MGRVWQRALGNQNEPLLMPSSLLIPLLTATGLAGFWLFYRAVDFCERI